MFASFFNLKNISIFRQDRNRRVTSLILEKVNAPENKKKIQEICGFAGQKKKIQKTPLHTKKTAVLQSLRDF